MTTVYSGYSKGWKPSGADVYRKYRARLDYWESGRTNTTITYSARVYLNIDHSVTVSSTYYYGGLNLSGTTASGKCQTKFKGATTVLCVGTISKTFTRGTANSSATISGSMKCTAGSWTGQVMSVSVSVSIPALAKYAVSFVMNGHGDQVSSQSIFYGYKAIEPTIPVDNHYGFLGWYTDVACTIPYNFNNAVTSNIVLYAKWIKLYPTTRVKVNGVWYRGEFRCKMNNQICDVVDGFTKVNGVWVPINRS